MAAPIELSKSLKRDIGLAPAGEITAKNILPFFSALRAEFSTSVQVPVESGEPGQVSVTGEWDSLDLSLSSSGGEFSAEVGISFVSNVMKTLKKVIAVAAVIHEDLVEELEEDADVILDGDDILSGHVAKAMADQAGLVNFYWDSRLNYEIVPSLEPVWYFNGAFQEGLEELISPINIAGETLAEIVVEEDGVSVLLVKEPEAPQVVALGDGYYLDSLSATKEAPERIRNLTLTWNTCKELEEVKETISEDTLSEDGVKLMKTVTYRKRFGTMILEEKKEEYQYTDQAVIDAWANGIPPIKVPEMQIIRTEEMTITLESDITPQNVCWLRSPKIKQKETITTTWQGVTRGNAPTGHWWPKIDTTTSVYSYNDDGEITAEVETSEERTYPSVLGEWTGEEDQEITIKQTKTTYEKISEDYVLVTKTEKSYRGGQYEGEDVLEADEGSVSTTLQSGTPPNGPSIGTPKDEEIMDEHSVGVAIGNDGEDIEEECEIDPTDYVDLIVHRLKSVKLSVSLSGKSLYDLKPGTWIDLTVAAGHDAPIRTIAAETETVSLSEIVDHLPPLFVRSVEVSRSGGEQSTNIDAVGWK